MDAWKDPHYEAGDFLGECQHDSFTARLQHHTQYQNYNTTLAEDFQEREIGKLNNYTRKL